MKLASQPIELSPRLVEIGRLVQQLARKRQQLVAADHAVARPSARHVEGFRLGQFAGNRFGWFPQQPGFEPSLVDLRWTRLESQSGPRKEGLSGRTVRGKDQHGPCFSTLSSLTQAPTLWDPGWRGRLPGFSPLARFPSTARPRREVNKALTWESWINAPAVRAWIHRLVNVPSTSVTWLICR